MFLVVPAALFAVGFVCERVLYEVLGIYLQRSASLQKKNKKNNEKLGPLIPFAEERLRCAICTFIYVWRERARKNELYSGSPWNLLARSAPRCDRAATELQPESIGKKSASLRKKKKVLVSYFQRSA